MAIAYREEAFASTARTATPTAIDLDTDGAAGCLIYIDVTAITSSPSVVFNCDGYDAIANEAYTLLDSVAITATGFTVLKIWPGVSASANTAANEWLPDRLRIARRIAALVVV